MPRYAPGSQPGYIVFDRTAIVDRNLDRIPDLDPMIRRVAHDMCRGCKSECGAQSYAQELTFYLGWCGRRNLDPLQADDGDADAYAADISGYSQGTQHLKLLVARLFYKTALRRAIKWQIAITENPFADMALPSRTPERITPSLTKQQVEAVLSAITSEFRSPTGLTAKRDYAVIMLMVRLALRATETTSLRWGLLQRTDGAIRTSFMGKGNKPGHLFVPEDVWDILVAYKTAAESELGVRLGPGDPVFVGLSPHLRAVARARTGVSPLPTLKRDHIYDIVKSRLLDVDIDGDRFGPHCLRATAAVLAYRAGATVLEIKALLRHSSIETTMRYLESVMGGASKAAIDRIQLNVPAWEAGSDAVT